MHFIVNHGSGNSSVQEEQAKWAAALRTMHEQDPIREAAYHGVPIVAMRVHGHYFVRIAGQRSQGGAPQIRGDAAP